jgi:hypothetical protein
MNLSERVAKSVIESALPGSRMEFRAMQSKSQWDFDLWLPNGERTALEVTASTDRRYLQFLAVLGDESRGGQFVSAERCQKDWWVHPEEGARIDRIKRKLDEYLWPIEESGLAEFLAPVDAYEQEAVRRIWRDLRVDSGQVVRWKPPRRIGIAAPGRGGFVDERHIARAVEKEAAKRDNIGKLEASGLAERHLFVFIDSSNHHAWGPMVSGMVPAAAPALPDAITHAWAVSSSGMLHRFRALIFTREGGWSDFGLVDAAVEPDPKEGRAAI